MQFANVIVVKPSVAQKKEKIQGRENKNRRRGGIRIGGRERKIEKEREGYRREGIRMGGRGKKRMIQGIGNKMHGRREEDGERKKR